MGQLMMFLLPFLALLICFEEIGVGPTSVLTINESGGVINQLRLIKKASIVGSQVTVEFEIIGIGEYPATRGKTHC